MPLSDSLPWFFLAILTIVSVDLLLTCFILRKEHETLKEEYAKRNLLLNSIAEGVYGLDVDGNCTFCNAATLKLLGYRSEAELVGRNIHDLIHHTHADGSAYAAADCKACLAYKHDQEVHLEDEILWRSDGTSFPAEYWSYPVRKGSALIGAVVSFVDITARKEIEARLREANRELDAFVHTVSHDLRTPISAVLGYADILRENHGHALKADAVELLEAIETQGYRMVVLVEDLLTLATVGNLPVPAEVADTLAEVDHVLAELREQIVSGGVTVVVDELPSIRIPGTLLAQIFQNLIGNAVRYAGEAGNRIEVGGSRNGDLVRFFVRDHGVGIPREEQDRIFDLFYRGSTGKKLVGSGIGLATVEKIARLYGGRGWVEETPGGGATFWVEMRDV